MTPHELNKILEQAWSCSEVAEERAGKLEQLLRDLPEADLYDYLRMLADRCNELTTCVVLSAYWCLHEGTVSGDKGFVEFRDKCAASPEAVFQDILKNPDHCDQYWPKIERVECSMELVAFDLLESKWGLEVAGLYSLNECRDPEELSYKGKSGYDLLVHADELTPRLWKKYVSPRVARWPADFEWNIF